MERDRVTAVRGLARRARVARRLRSGHALVGNAAPHRAHGLCEAVEHRLRAELVVKRIAVYTELARGLRDVALARRHRGDDVLSFERFDRLCQCDSVPDQLSDDGIQTIVDAYHVLNLEGICVLERRRDSTTQESSDTKKKFSSFPMLDKKINLQPEQCD